MTTKDSTIYEVVIHADKESLERLNTWLEFADLAETDIFKIVDTSDITAYYKTRGTL